MIDLFLQTIINFLQVDAVGAEVTRLRSAVEFSPKDQQLVVREDTMPHFLS